MCITLRGNSIPQPFFLSLAVEDKVLPCRTAAVVQFRLLKDSRRFVGMAGLCTRLVNKFCSICERLRAMKREGGKFLWGSSQQEGLRLPEVKTDYCSVLTGSRFL